MIITIQDLSFDAIIGILPFERTTPQKVVVQSKIHYVYTPQNRTFIDYAHVVHLIKEEIMANQYELVETALCEIIEKLKETFPLITFVELTLTKPTILSDAVVGVTLTHHFS